MRPQPFKAPMGLGVVSAVMNKDRREPRGLLAGDLK